jgi:HD-GYP domain-containing protein (c-di-GMP phosphodiesterase class II)
MGIPLLRVDLEGQIVNGHQVPDDWIGGLLVASPLFQQTIAQRTRRWLETGTELPHVEELWPGCCVSPMPIGRPHRREGFHVALFVTSQLLASEQFHPICDAAEIDVAAARQRVDAGQLTGRAEMGRLARMLQWMAGDLAARQSHDQAIDSLSSELTEAYEELSLLYKLSAKMPVTQDSRQFLTEACTDLQTVLGLRWIMLYLVDDEPRLKELAGSTVQAGDIVSQGVSLEQLGKAAMSLCEQRDEPLIIDDTSEAGLPIFAQVADGLLIVPLWNEQQPLGVIVAADKAGDIQLSSVDSKLVRSTSQNIGIFLDNAMLYDDLQDMFMGTLRSLVSAIDAKDTYTFGHSERVAWGARELALAAGMDQDQAHRVYLSGLVHDVGKIGVPEAVLCKPGRLTDEEFEMIKTHPRIGSRILQEVRQMQDLLPGVLYHHERFDGRGYPEGLRGVDIPMFGRLICLADSFDAMSSNRTYRSALPMKDVLAEIRRCSGTQFDPDLAKLFVELDFQPFEQMLIKHRQRNSPLRREMVQHHEAQA